MQLLLVALGIAAFVAWASAAVHALLLLGHVAPPRSAASLIFQGFRFFDRDTFAPSGHALHRRFVASVLTFFLLVLVTIPIAVLGAASGNPRT